MTVRVGAVPPLGRRARRAVSDTVAEKPPARDHDRPRPADDADVAPGGGSLTREQTRGVYAVPRAGDATFAAARCRRVRSTIVHVSPTSTVRAARPQSIQSITSAGSASACRRGRRALRARARVGARARTPWAALVILISVPTAVVVGAVADGGGERRRDVVEARVAAAGGDDIVVALPPTATLHFSRSLRCRPGRRRGRQLVQRRDAVVGAVCVRATQLRRWRSARRRSR